ncbi:uncharacterized protein MELLADRAFT_57979 [Melampsora larici-populina 98AG31]|uniref:Uncharacterized protein n=1 Tax=Melampsora larici-populina (strain 98AG31 / pathotype 3-4-7) TaxID=747676 RepID=F4S8Z6_MELLP|nr:uncharacterized protein MELLADRAFT_57979 [Melampsora larici-populina 98AG31]EGF98904.1 hypothetical protein MELLADRAFT_57979 [Melampsora larici-populina 98AG31]
MRGGDRLMGSVKVKSRNNSRRIISGPRQSRLKGAVDRNSKNRDQNRNWMTPSIQDQKSKL